MRHSFTPLNWPSKDQIWFQQLEDILSSQLANSQYNIPQLAEDMAISERQLRRRLKRLTGLSPLNYVKGARLRQAQLLLEQKRYKTVAQTAAAVGFQSPDTFTRNFTQYFGNNPSYYLKDMEAFWHD